MSDEIHLRHTATGNDIYATISDQASLIWNGAAFEVFVVANWGTYDVATTETPANSYLYLVDFPAGITTAGTYEIIFYDRLGGAPAITDTVLEKIEIIWDGTAEVTHEMLWDLWAAMFLKHKMVLTGAGASTITRYHRNGTTELNTQAATDDGTTQQIAKAV